MKKLNLVLGNLNKAYHIEKLTNNPRDIGRLKDLYFGSFTGSQGGKILEKNIHDPLAATLSLQSLQEYTRYVIDVAVEEEKSFFIQDDEMISYILNTDFTRKIHSDQRFLELSKWDKAWEPIVKMIETLEDRLDKKCGGIKLGESFRIQSCGTLIGAHRRTGLASSLFQHSIQYATQHNYKFLFSNVASKISQSVLKKLGFTVFTEIFYKDFEHPRGVYPYKSISIREQSVQTMIYPIHQSNPMKDMPKDVNK